MFADLTIKEFLRETASSKPVPGGGSVAALAGALSAALSEMVANLTIGRKGYEELDNEMKEIVRETKKYREKLVEYVDKDSDAYNGVMAAYKMPKETEAEKEKRSIEIQKSLKHATMVPLEVADDTFYLIQLAGKVVRNGNKNAVTDGAVATMMARTAVHSAIYNVKINLASIKDNMFVDDVSKKLQTLENKIDRLEKEILSEIQL